VREVVNAAGTVQQVTNYYPFGATYFDDSAVKASDYQPYKFNGKEFDKMYGLNTYDYGARQYNPVTARWDRMDPLCEKNPDVTPYHFCHNNPVNRVDPDGRDDYFNSSGAFMYSTSKGSNVYVNNVLITDVSLTNGASRQAVANVMGHYAHQVGISFYAKGGRPVGESPRGTLSLADFGKSSDATPAHTKGDNIQINKHDSKIGSALHDKYNIMSTLEHEKFHKEAGHGLPEKGKITNSAHAGVYAKQIGSSIFLKTTGDYQDGIISSFIKFLESAIKDGVNEGRINSLIEDVNNSLQKSGRQIYYERTGSDSYSIYCK
jgi:RHS repeat-associated protein